jgi:hypothetical protein
MADGNGVSSDIAIAGKYGPVREIIGRRAVGIPRIMVAPSVDWTRADYAFWDQLRRGKKTDYEIGGLFSRPIARTLTSWAFGRGFGVEVADSETTEEAAQQFATDNLKPIIDVIDDSLSLGDSYFVVNIDASLTRVSPEQVEILAEPAGSRNVIGYRITTKLDAMTIRDTYKLDGRELEIEAGGKTTTQKFTNLIGMLPVIHFTCDQAANEVHGRPYYEQLLKLMLRYDRTANKTLDGVDAMGNPFPVIEGVEDPDETLANISTGQETVSDSKGNQVTRYQVDFTQLPVLVLGKGGHLNLAAPNQFTGDATQMLEILFLLMLQTTGIPEWVWGGAIASSKASVDAQMPAFERLIDGLRLAYTAPLLQLIRVWVATRALVEPGLNVAAQITLNFPSIAVEDRTQKLEEIKFAEERKLIRKVTALRLLNLVDDPEAEVKAAEAEAADSESEFDRALDDLVRNPPPDEELPQAA